jgi:hypothetical protein
MPSRVWEQYASLTLWERPPDAGRREVMRGTGRGYYRTPSLLSVWAYAPFMLNNALGPEVCGKPSDPALDLYTSPYVDADGKPLADPPACRPFDASVEGRYQLYKDSMEALLYPERRAPKMFATSEDIIVDVAPEIRIGDLETGLQVTIPKGFPAAMINSLRYKDLIQDMVLNQRNPAKLEAKYAGLLPPDRFAELKTGLSELRNRLIAQAGTFQLDISEVQSDFIQSYYSNVLDLQENAGHTFGSDLSDREKQALIAFLATL